MIFNRVKFCCCGGIVNKNKGFTLIELMVTIAVLGIIAAMAVPSFQSVIQKNELKKGTEYVLFILNDAKNNEKLLADLKPLRKDGETIEGWFVCVLALVQHAEDPLPQIFQGIWKGEVLEQARGENGFGYDPLFWLPELGISSAEMSKEDKNKISHRGQAMQLFKASLAK